MNERVPIPHHLISEPKLKSTMVGEDPVLYASRPYAGETEEYSKKYEWATFYDEFTGMAEACGAVEATAISKDEIYSYVASVKRMQRTGSARRRLCESLLTKYGGLHIT